MSDKDSQPEINPGGGDPSGGGGPKADPANAAHPAPGDLRKTPEDEKRDDLTVGAQPVGPQKPSKVQVVGIGASAGGLAALKRLLSLFPDKPGISIGIVVHLHPEYESHMAELLQPFCRMPVRQNSGTFYLVSNPAN